MSSTIDVQFHVVIGQYFQGVALVPDGKPSVRVSKGRPSVEAHEVAILLNLRLPKALFVRPSLSASITVPENSAPLKITPEVQSNIARVIEEQLGIVLKLSAPEREANA